MNDSVALLVRMLEIDSLSGRETALARFLVGAMRAHGFDAFVDDAGNAIGVLDGPPAPGARREIVLLGHMDTVPGRLPVVLSGDVLTGRGAVDAKGPLAAFVCAAARAELAPGSRVVVIGAVDEEGASKGARAIVDRHRPHACVIGEPSGWDAITLGYKGSMRVEYRATHEVGHTAGPDASVADDAVDWWQSVRVHVGALNRELRSSVFDRIQSRLNGIATSTDGLADEVTAAASFRLPPGVDAIALFEAVRACAGVADIRLLGQEPAFVTDRTNPIAPAFLRGIRAAGGEPRFKKKTGTSDMNVVGPVWNCPILAYGPGDSSLDHSPNEAISISEYLRSIDVLTSAIADISRADLRARGGDRVIGEIRDHRFHSARG